MGRWYQDGGGRPVIEHSLIINNSTPYEGGGLAASWDSRPTLRNNLIAGKSAALQGAGIRLRDTRTTLVNNTIAHNTGAGSDSAVNLALEDRRARTDSEVDDGTVHTGYHYRVVRWVYLPLVAKG